jgi:GNAT superfamily N-acetyltransferase
MREFITLVEHLMEIERGGYVDAEDFGDVPEDVSGDQLDLFEPNTTGEPRIPQGWEMVGKAGQYFVMREKDTGANNITLVAILNGKTAGMFAFHKWTREAMNYPHEYNWKPELLGEGLRVSSVYVREDFRGKGLTQLMYQWVLENLCDYIIAGSLQSSDGEKLWKNLKRNPNLAMMVWDPERLKHRDRRSGKDFDNVYNVYHLIPWITLKSKLNDVLD